MVRIDLAMTRHSKLIGFLSIVGMAVTALGLVLKEAMVVYLILCVVPVIFAGIVVVLIISRRVEAPANISPLAEPHHSSFGSIEVDQEAAHYAAIIQPHYKGNSK
jgi:hypothetical protein